jgi:flagellar biosynthesis/type III secretory pathway protein FliH
MRCNGGEEHHVEFNKWYAAQGNCIVEILAGERGIDLRLEVAGESSQALNDLSKDYPRWERFVTYKGLQVRVTGDARSTREPLLTNAEIIVLALAVVLLAMGAGWLLLQRRNSRHAAVEEPVTTSIRTGNALANQPVEVLPTAKGAPAGPKGLPPKVPAAERTKDELKELRHSIRWLEQGLQKLEANQRSIQVEIDRSLERFLQAVEEEFASGLNEAIRKNLELNKDTHKQIAEFHDRLQRLELQLKRLNEDGRRGLRELLAAIPLQVLDRENVTTAPDQVTLATQLDRAVTRCLSEGTANSVLVRNFLERLSRLEVAVRKFQEVARIDGQQAESKLRPLEEDIALIRKELEALSDLDANKSLRLLFAIDFATHEGARRTVGDAIAAGLEREIVKLSNLNEYYERRLILIAGRAAAECADFADSRLDPERSRSEIQAAVRQVLEAGDIEEIIPHRNDEFRALEHHVLQLVRRSLPSDRSGAVASVLARGLKYGGHVIRKASVLIFE